MELTGARVAAVILLISSPRHGDLEQNSHIATETDVLTETAIRFRIWLRREEAASPRLLIMLLRAHR